MLVFNSYSDSQRKRLVRQESTLYDLNTNNSVVTLTKGTRLQNAKGTSNDSVETYGKQQRKMIELWEDLTGKAALSCSNKYCPYDDLDLDIDDLVGAHVVKVGHNTNLEWGDEVLIIPLCKKCNNYHNEDEIVLKKNTKAVVLIWE